jgi:hypothetical protein
MNSAAHQAIQVTASVNAALIDASKRGAVIAMRGCGRWPLAATLAEFEFLAARAGREADRAIEAWGRWRRRFDPDPERLEMGSARVNTRFEVARAIAEQRSAVLRALTDEPAGEA